MRNQVGALKLGTLSNLQGTYTLLWGVSALIQKNCPTFQPPLGGIIKNTGLFYS
jgi:hypothetical protein